jgi:2-polyprenyl-6-methoxyphenol hydroxylase-like FAD-dependent oxidoreductase
MPAAPIPIFRLTRTDVRVDIGRLRHFVTVADDPSMSSATDAPTAPVVIVGAGPVGLALALGLDRHGIRTVVLEREATTSRHAKAIVLHVRTREILRSWGAEAPFLAAGTLLSSLTLHAASDGRPLVTISFDDLAAEAEAPGLLLLEQSETERLLLDELRRGERCQVRFGTSFTGLRQDLDGVSVTLSRDGDEEVLRAAYVVGCDGASSAVRDAIGMPFDGLTYRVRPMLADVHLDGDRDRLPWPRQHHSAHGTTTAIRLRPGCWRIIRLDEAGNDANEGRRGDRRSEVTDDEVQRRVAEVLGPGPVEVAWAGRFRIHKRASPRFRVGRVLLAGDAAHVHSPVGGLGMNAGIQDAHNLAWKLAAGLGGGDVARLLDSYDVERRAVVVEQVSRITDIATRLFIQSPAPVRERGVGTLRWLLKVGAVRRRGLRALTMLDLTYPGSPLLDPTDRAAGLRVPDPVLLAPDGREVRLHRLFPATAPLLIEVSSFPARDDRPPRTGPPAPDREVGTLHIGPGGHHDGDGMLRGLLGGDDGWILVRPDRHIAWARVGPARPDPATIGWSLGRLPGSGAQTQIDPPRSPTGDSRPSARGPGGALREGIRRIRARTDLDMPHYR